MRPALARAAGAGSVLGAVLFVVTTVPSRWFGVPETDSYVFSPPAFGPLWVERTLIPAFIVVSLVLLAAGLAALVARDRPVAGRLRRWSGYAAVFGVAVFALSTVALVGSGLFAGGLATATNTLTFLVAGLAAVVGFAIAVVGTVLLGVGYLRVDRPRLGAALVAGPLVTVGSLALFSFLSLPVEVGGLPFGLAFAATFAAVGVELWTRPDAVAESPSGAREEADAPDAGESA